MKTVLISDTHFFHFLVNEYSNRPFIPKIEGDKLVLKYKGKFKDFYFEESIFGLNEKQVEKLNEKKTIDWMNEILIYNWNHVVNPEDTIIHVGDAFWSNKENMKNLLKRLNGYKILIKGNHDRSSKAMIDVGFNEVHETYEMMIGDEKVILSHYPYVPYQLVNMALKRPNPLNLKSTKGENIPIPDDLKYEDMVDFLSRFNNRSIYTNNDDSKDYLIKIQRMISKFIGTRLINQGQILIHGHTHSSEKRYLNMINLSVEAWEYAPVLLEEIIPLISDWKKQESGEVDLTEEEHKYLLAYLAFFKNNEKLKESLEINSLKKYYKLGDKVTTVPKNYSQQWYNLALSKNMFISKNDLVHGHFYKGCCRNSNWAYWDKHRDKFFYIRSKFGSSFVEEINPIENDNGFDLFIPHEEYFPTNDEVNEFWRLF